MRNHFGLKVVATLFMLTAAARPASAQEPPRLMIGGTVVAPSGLGGSAVFEIPLGSAAGGSLSLLAGAAAAPTNHRVVFGGGVKYTRQLNDKARFFVEALAGLLIRYGNGTRREFGMTPAAGFLYAVRDRMDFFAMVGPGVIEKGFETRYGVQITAGIVVPLK